MNIDQEIKFAKQVALRLLSRKGYFSAEIRAKLLLKGVSEEAIEVVLEKCKCLGLINDDEERRLYIERAQKKGYGPRRIDYQLARKGVAGKVQADQISLIMALLETRYKRLSLKKIKDKQKIFLSLQRRGFEFESINQAFLLKLSQDI
jgi:regulatory protein